MRDVMRSPLEDLHQGPASWVRILATGVAAALGAAAVTYGVLRMLPEPAEQAEVTIATIAAEPTPPSHGLPIGYVDTGSGYGLRVEWFMQLDEELLVGISSAVSSDSDPTELRPIGATILGPTRRAVGTWTLRLADGRAIRHTAEHLDDAATGMLTVSFPVTGLTDADVETLEVAAAVGAGMRVEETRLPVDGVPADLSGNAIEVGATELVESGSGPVVRSGESRLIVDRLEVGWSSGWVEWHLEGIEGVAARLEAAVSLRDGETGTETLLVPEIDVGPRFLQRGPAPLTPGVSGSIHLVRVGSPGGPHQVTMVEISWTVSWARYAEETTLLPAAGTPWITNP
jgi:hypothetical protein